MIRALAGQTIGAELINATTGAAFAGTVTVFVTIDAGVQALGTVGAGVCQAEGNGYFSYRPSAAETDGALIAFTFTGTGAIPATIQVATLSPAQAAAVTNTTVPGATTISARDLVTRAYQTLGVYGLEDTIGGAALMAGFRRLNSLISNWATQPLTIPTSSRTVIPITTGKGTEANPITIGPTGDVVMATRPLELEAASLLLAGPAPQIEIGRAVLTSSMWNSIAIKALTSSLFTGVYYVPSVPNGEIVLWPVPDTTIHSLVIYRGEQLAPFANPSSTVVLLDGYIDALDFNLAIRLAPGSGVGVTPELRDLARSSLADLKRANVEMTDLANDFAWGGGYYNILTGQGG